MDRGARIDRRAAMRRGALLVAGLVAAPVAGALAACAAAEPRPIAFGRDECAYCRMVISDPRYAASLLTAKGRTVVFDSAECAASYSAQAREDGGRDAGRLVWVSDYDRPGTLIPARQARFVRAGGPGSPMGKGLAAFRSDADARRLSAGAATSGWDEVIALVAREGLRRGISLNIVPATPGAQR